MVRRCNASMSLDRMVDESSDRSIQNESPISHSGETETRKFKYDYSKGWEPKYYIPKALKEDNYLTKKEQFPPRLNNFMTNGYKKR